MTDNITNLTSQPLWIQQIANNSSSTPPHPLHQFIFNQLKDYHTQNPQNTDLSQWLNKLEQAMQSNDLLSIESALSAHCPLLTGVTSQLKYELSCHSIFQEQQSLNEKREELTRKTHLETNVAAQCIAIKKKLKEIATSIQEIEKNLDESFQTVKKEEFRKTIDGLKKACQPATQMQCFSDDPETFANEVDAYQKTCQIIADKGQYGFINVTMQGISMPSAAASIAKAAQTIASHVNTHYDMLFKKQKNPNCININALHADIKAYKKEVQSIKACESAIIALEQKIESLRPDFKQQLTALKARVTERKQTHQNTPDSLYKECFTESSAWHSFGSGWSVLCGIGLLFFVAAALVRSATFSELLKRSATTPQLASIKPLMLKLNTHIEPFRQMMTTRRFYISAALLATALLTRSIVLQKAHDAAEKGARGFYMHYQQTQINLAGIVAEDAAFQAWAKLQKDVPPLVQTKIAALFE